MAAAVKPTSSLQDKVSAIQQGDTTMTPPLLHLQPMAGDVVLTPATGLLHLLLFYFGFVFVFLYFWPPDKCKCVQTSGLPYLSSLPPPLGTSYRPPTHSPPPASADSLG